MDALRTLSLALVLSSVLAACGTVTPATPEGPPDATAPDAALATDAGVPLDAAIDAPPPSPGQDLVGAGGRLTGATFTMDVQVGHPTGHAQITGGTFRASAHTPLQP